jgi:hypothetical protein
MQFTQNQNNQMSEDDLKDGSRNAVKPGRDGEKTAAERPPEQDEQSETAIEAFADEGAGVAAKE